ncbi:MAG: transporter [Saprospiraceae bacterium]|nr:transporter [Saprospiraceae bacterium]
MCVTTFTQVNAQGCVAIRGFSSCSGTMGNSFALMKGDLLLGTNFRHFKSFRHFRGDHEEKNRVEDGTEVINKSSLLDLTLNYAISDRIYTNVTIPFVFHDRSSMYEHGGNPPNGLGERHSTHSSGLSDIRMGLGYWLIDPIKHSKTNYSVGLGVKLPTGKYDYMDIFYNQGDDRNENIESVVDQSIQPGDGGTGITLDIAGYHTLSNHLMITNNFYYMSNPKTTNGVLTRNGREEFSCPDQFAARIGLNYFQKQFSAYLGGRIEGVPSSDLIGSSAGYRRPGYVASVEPGISYALHNLIFSLNVPVALYRNRIQSFSDKQRTEETGVYRIGDAAFANYLLNFNVSYRFSKKAEADFILEGVH